MFCEQCGTPIEGGAKFCSKCGHSINATSGGSQNSILNPEPVANLDPAVIVQLTKSVIPAFFKIFLVFFGIFGIIAFGFFFFRHQLAEATKHWPQTQGVVIKTSTRQFWSVSNTSTSTSTVYHNNYNTQTQRTLMYSPEVLYQYSVGAQNYTSSKVSYFNPSSSSEADIDVIIDRYPVGKQVTVYYNPQKPSESVLEPG